MEVAPGTRLGPYEIVSRIGVGGMGEVYRARDTRLDRSVAIKVLPAEFSRNAQLKVRFEREAKTISQLNHPNICTLYDVGDDYLVMELLEGETLAERIARGPLPLADVLRIGSQIAEALDRAHRAGVVHRDLKPANVMLTKAGAKLLDFGLAKPSAQNVDPNSATVHHDKALTQEGTILGTFQYMAPEQLEAEEADARTDIFALGAVLYEMATGARAFQGKTKTSLIAAIVGSQPQPLAQILPLTPPALDHVIQKCLEKEREDRWQSAHDVAEELKWISTVPVDQKFARSRVAKLASAAAILLALALAGVTTLYVRARNAPKPRTSFAILPPKDFSFGTRHLSPDGMTIAFSSYGLKDEGGIWTRRVDEIEPKRLTTHPDDRVVAWSPDSKWIAYMSRGPSGFQLKKIAGIGGTPEMISQYVQQVNAASWGHDGTILFSRAISDGLFIVRPDGAPPVEITKIDASRKESFVNTPHLLSDSKRFVYLSHTIASQKNEIWAGSIDGKGKKQLLRADGLVGLALGHLYFVNDGSIYAQQFDEDDLTFDGEPKRVVERVQFSEPAGSAQASVARTGALLYSPIVSPRVEWGWYDRNGRRLEKVYEEKGLFANALSPDGKRVAATRSEPSKGADDVHIVDLERGLRTRLTSGLSHNFSPVWSPDGKRIYFVSDRDGPYDIFVQDADGATPAVTVWKSDRDKEVHDVTPDGKALICSASNPETRSDLWLVPIDDPEKRKAIVATEADEMPAVLSPDGRWLAYLSDRSGRREVYVRSLDGGPTAQVSTTGTTGCAWSADGKELLVRMFDGERVAVPFMFSGNEAVPGKAVHLFAPPARNYGLIKATQRGLLMETVPDPTDYIFPIYYDSAPLN